MMKRVLIFTDEDSWSAIDLDRDVKAQWNPLYPNGSRRVVKFDLALNHFCVFPTDQSLCCYHREPRCVSQSCFRAESITAPTYLVVFFFIESIFTLAVFHFTDVDDVVGPLYNDVYLDCRSRCLASPGIDECRDGIYPQCLFDLLDMCHTDAFKCQAHP